MQSSSSENPGVIAYTLGACTLGFVLVAASRRGVCAVFLGEDNDSLLAQAKRRLPGAVLDRNPELERLLLQVIAAVETPTKSWGVNLDLRGSKFQQRVWQALRQIPPGTTTSYAENRCPHRFPTIHQGRCVRLRGQPGGNWGPLPPSHPQYWRNLRLSLGCFPETAASRPRGENLPPKWRVRALPRQEKTFSHRGLKELLASKVSSCPRVRTVCALQALIPPAHVGP